MNASELQMHFVWDLMQSIIGWLLTLTASKCITYHKNGIFHFCSKSELLCYFNNLPRKIWQISEFKSDVRVDTCTNYVCFFLSSKTFIFVWCKVEVEVFYLKIIDHLQNFVDLKDQLEVCLTCSRLLTGIPINANGIPKFKVINDKNYSKC